MQEKWRAVVGFEGWYEVSSIGRVRRVKAGPRTYAGRLLNPRPNTEGYLWVILYREGRRHNFAVHRLVMEAFIGPRAGSDETNHIDGRKTNNSVTNLEYTTKSGNQKHAVRIGLRTPARGERNGFHRLSDDAVRHIRSSNAPTAALAKHLGVHYGTVWLVRRGVTWTHTA